MRKIILGSIIGVSGFISLQAAAEVTMISATPADNSVVKSISKISTVWDATEHGLNLTNHYKSH